VQELRDLLAACKTWRSSLTANSLYEPNDADQKLFEAIDRADLKDDEEKGSADGC
jgi:predicted lipoprotein